MFFGELTSANKIYLGSNIPEKKLSNMIKHLQTDFFEDKVALVYYDDTVWGKGDNGYALFDYSDLYQYLLVSVYGGIKMVVCLEDDGGYYISAVSYSEKEGLTIDVSNNENDDVNSYLLGFKNSCGQALFRYLNNVING
jgi:hypothetical protein